MVHSSPINTGINYISITDFFNKIIMKEKNIQMVDLMGQYHKIKQEIDHNIISLIESGKFVNGPIVNEFAINLSTFLNVKNVIPCANGTDALQIAFMALNLKP